MLIRIYFKKFVYFNLRYVLIIIKSNKNELILYKKNPINKNI